MTPVISGEALNECFEEFTAVQEKTKSLIEEETE